MMRLNRTPYFFTGFALMATLSAPAFGDEILRAAIDRPGFDPDEWAVTHTMRVGAMDEGVIIVERQDPSKPAGERSQLLAMTDLEGNPISEDEAENDTELDFDLPLYSDLNDFVENGYEIIEETATYKVYRVNADKNGDFNFGDVDVGDEDYDDHLNATMTVVKNHPTGPYVSNVHFELDESAGNFVAKVKELMIDYSFVPDSESGTMLITDFSLDLNLSALFFINVDTHVDLKLSDFQYVGTRISYPRP